MKNYEIKEFNLDGEKISLKFIKNPKIKFIAKASNFGLFGLGYISVEETFFKEFSKEEQKSIIYHELWHYENNLKFEIKILFSRKFWIFFCNNKLKKLQEIEADKYSAKQNGKENMINVLKQINKLHEENKIKYNFKNHPSPEERIKFVEGLE